MFDIIIFVFGNLLSRGRVFVIVRLLSSSSV